MEDDLQWKTTFGGRQSSVEHNLWWKRTFSGRQTFGGRLPSVEGNFWWQMTIEMTLNFELLLLEVKFHIFTIGEGHAA